MKLKEQLAKFIKSPYNPINNFNMGICYSNIGQTTSAYTFFLRTTDYSDDDDLIYESLIQAGRCLARQGNHKMSERGMYLHAISLQPNRPEAYYILSQYYEQSKDWIGSYSTACTGLETTKHILTTSNLEYPGYYGLVFQKAVSSWWIGRHLESKELFKRLVNDYKSKMNFKFKELVHNNIVFLNAGRFPKLPYTSLIYDKLKYKFKDSEHIERNYSQSYQDMFVLSMLNGKINGTYLEIGSADPFSGNNTALLETKFNWKGVSIDIVKDEVDKFNKERTNQCVLADATKIDYAKLIIEQNLGTDIDYLQLDCDPSSVTYDILTKIPFDKYRFGVITYEHDFYADKSKPSYRNKSRGFLKARGYELVASNIAPNDTDNYEDWWIHPKLINRTIIEIFKNNDDTIKNASQYMSIVTD